MLFVIFLYLLNYFWLSDNPDETASWYCDQHCFKIGMEVMEAIWAVVRVIASNIKSEFAPKSNGNRHFALDTTWHPLAVWHGLCRENMRRGLINANAIFEEHRKRRGVEHSFWPGCKFLLDEIGGIDFNSKEWEAWYATQNTPKREGWMKLYDIQTKRGNGWYISPDRNICEISMPVVCINDSNYNFSGCKVEGDAVTSYRLYYLAKLKTIKGGMRYLYSSPPPWITDTTNIVFKRKSDKKLRAK